MIDAVSGGSLNNKTHEKAQELIDMMPSNNYSECDQTKEVARVFNVKHDTVLTAQLSTIKEQLN